VAVVDLERDDAASRIDRACRTTGFFALAGHGVPDAWRTEVLDAATELFALPEAAKAEVGLAAGGRAWRGWFPLGGELTSGVPDRKEGFYVGRDEPPDGRAMHGRNVWPPTPAELRPAVERWMAAMEVLGQRVLGLMAVGLGLGKDRFRRSLTADPTVLLRIFRYPPQHDEDGWGVAEHSDYGLLTLLAHDGTPGLEVHTADGWVAAPHDPALIVCNLGDMLDRLTAGRYRSTPHRVRNHAGHDRLSVPFFLDPGWDAVVEPLVLDDGWVERDDAAARWDRSSLRTVGGTYGDWLTA
jgi:isopenicillin N synthase-like dioxygenase